MTMLRTLLLWAALLGGWAFVPQAHAATTCSISPSELNFGAVDDTGAGTATATFNVDCQTDELFLPVNQARVKLCLKIGNGNVGTAGGLRLMRPPSTTDTLAFQIYSDAARSIPWTYSDTPPTAVEIAVNYPLTSFFGLFTSGSGSGQFTLYGGAAAQSLAAGNFSATFPDTQMVYRYTYGTTTVPTACNSGGTSATPVTTSFAARAQVPSFCRISTASDLDFGGNAGIIDANRDSTSAISLACRNRSVWNVGLNNGVNALGNTRRMRMGAYYVSYELYRDSSRMQRWGNTVNSDTYPGTSTAATSTVIVYGRVPGSPTQSVPNGTYSDTVTVTVTY